MNHPLLDLNQFAIDHPPRDFGEGQWVQLETHEVHLRACTRVRIIVEETPDIGYGLWRHEKLGEAGIYSDNADSLAFAEQLYAKLGDRLTPRNLEHLIQVLARELATLRQERSATAFNPLLQGDSAEIAARIVASMPTADTAGHPSVEAAEPA